MFSDSQEGLLAGTHSAFAFVPINVIAPPEEVIRIKADLAKTTSLSSSESLRKQHKLLEAWFDDTNHAQVE